MQKERSIEDGDKVRVVAGTHAGKAGEARNRKVTATGAVTITVLQADGTRFKTLAKNAVHAD